MFESGLEVTRQGRTDRSPDPGSGTSENLLYESVSYLLQKDNGRLTKGARPTALSAPMASHISMIHCSLSRETAASWNIRDLRVKYNLPDYAGASCPPHPAPPIAPRLKLNRHIRKAPLDVRLAPDLSATPERTYDELRGSGRPET